MTAKRRPLSDTQVDEIIGRFVRSEEWVWARRSGYELPLLESLRGRRFRFREQDRAHMRSKAAAQFRQYADAIELGDTSVIAIMRGWFDDVRATEVRHALPEPARATEAPVIGDAS